MSLHGHLSQLVLLGWKIFLPEIFSVSFISIWTLMMQDMNKTAHTDALVPGTREMLC